MNCKQPNIKTEIGEANLAGVRENPRTRNAQPVTRNAQPDSLYLGRVGGFHMQGGAP